jgi:peptide/nickel transport system permease protein
LKINLLSRLKQLPRRLDLKRRWFRFSRSPLSVVGLIIAVASIAIALFAPFIAPDPKSAGLYVNLDTRFQPPSWSHLFGTDEEGRDILSRTLFGFQYSLTMAAVVLVLVAPLGVVLGLVAGYYRGKWLDTVIMRIADIFIAVPPLVLALAVASVLSPSLFDSMMAVSLMWWPWYTRLTFNTSSQLRNEYFVQAAEVMGASPGHIMFSEILPNCLGPILTKLTLDVGWVILLGSALSFVGLGAQAPTPDLGTMVSKGAAFMPAYWWLSIFPAMAIVFIILGFNLLGDGVRDMFTEESR